MFWVFSGLACNLTEHSHVENMDWIHPRALRTLIISLALCLSGAPLAHALPPVPLPFSHPELVGEGRLQVLFWDVYDARLYAEAGHYRVNQPFALSMTYLRNVSASRIVESSIDALGSQGVDDGTLAEWRDSLESIFADVSSGDTVTGVYQDNGTATLYQNERVLGYLSDPNLSRGFFEIWLGEATPEPALRKQLLGVDES